MKIFSKKTYHLLNYLTLGISDKEIAHQYAIARAAHFNRIYRALITVSILYFLRHLLDRILYPDKSMYDLMSSVMILIFMIIWGIVKWRSQIHAPKVIILYGLMMCTMTNLSIRNQLPDWI